MDYTFTFFGSSTELVWTYVDGVQNFPDLTSPLRQLKDAVKDQLCLLAN